VAEDVVILALLAVRTLHTADQQQGNADRHQSGEEVFNNRKSMKETEHIRLPPLLDYTIAEQVDSAATFFFTAGNQDHSRLKKYIGVKIKTSGYFFLD
jgi:hypothetical protein